MSSPGMNWATESSAVADKPTWSFKDRYAGDHEFKRQVDEGRRRRNAERNYDKLKESLAMTKTKKKLY